MLTEKVIRLEYNIQNDKKSACEIGNRPVATAAVPRTCREARSGDPTLNSGMYWIDPDGQGVGDGPIYVYCDMNSGKTFFSAFDCNGEDDESINIVPCLVSRVDIHSAQQRIANKCWALR